MVLLVVLIDQLIWRPVIAWADKFKMEQVESADSAASPILDLIRKSPLLHRMSQGIILPLTERMYMLSAGKTQSAETPSVGAERRGKALRWTTSAVIIGFLIWAVFEAFLTLKGVTRTEVGTTVAAAGATFLRVVVSLVIGSLWTIPAGVAIGFNPKLSRIAQPLAQIAASVPAPALFPILLLGLLKLGGGLTVGSVLLMLLGTQWYILFNVIAGAMAIPSEFREVGEIFGFSRLDRWRTVILPGIFPYLVTGLVTASGGAWNASIIAEYFQFKGNVLQTFGLGAQISAATDKGNYPLLLLSTVVMAILVVSVNRLVWRPMYHIAEQRYRLET
jgi:NitT/TauT family transport system permease protein